MGKISKPPHIKIQYTSISTKHQWCKRLLSACWCLVLFCLWTRLSSWIRDVEVETGLCVDVGTAVQSSPTNFWLTRFQKKKNAESGCCFSLQMHSWWTTAALTEHVALPVTSPLCVSLVKCFYCEAATEGNVQCLLAVNEFSVHPCCHKHICWWENVVAL